MIVHTWRNALASKLAHNVVVATDSEEILDCMREEGATVCLTSPKHKNGTQRVHEAIKRFKEPGQQFDVVVNLQVDEPMVSGTIIDDLIRRHNYYQASTLMTSCYDWNECVSPNTVKVVAKDSNDKAVYFSRSVIPYATEETFNDMMHFKHIGIYAFRYDTLVEVANTKDCDYGEAENLEQLRILEKGFPMNAFRVFPPTNAAKNWPISVNDLESYNAWLEAV